MKQFLSIALFVLIIAGCANSSLSKQKPVYKNGSNDIMRYSIASALNSPLAKEKLSNKIKFVFGTKNKDKSNIIKKGLVSNKKTNGVGKDDQVSCERAFISALIAFQNQAISEGANKVVNLVSYFKKNTFDSKTEYECAIGNIISGVALKGDIAK